MELSNGSRGNLWVTTVKVGAMNFLASFPIFTSTLPTTLVVRSTYRHTEFSTEARSKLTFQYSTESILAKRRGYGTLVSYNVPPYGRAGLYLELANLKELVDEYRSNTPKGGMDLDLLQTIFGLAQRSGMLNDVPFRGDEKSSNDTVGSLPEGIESEEAFEWVARLYDYLNVLQDRLFSSGLHSFGSTPTDEELDSYLEAYFGDRLSERHRREAISKWRESSKREQQRKGFFASILAFLRGKPEEPVESDESTLLEEATSIVSLLGRSSEEIDSIVEGLDGGYIHPAPGGDLLRDGTSVLPTGRNIHALDPYRMPSPSAWARGKRAASEIIRQHQQANGGKYPETVAVTLWGLDSIKTRGESVAIALALVGAEPIKEGTGRIVRYDLVPLEELGRPRIDVLASLSGIFRYVDHHVVKRKACFNSLPNFVLIGSDSFANIVDLLDDMFERAAKADEPTSMNFLKKHVLELEDSGVTERAAARLFSNP